MRYCINNPLKYTDPSGDFIWFVIAGAFIGAEVGGWISSGTPAFWKWNSNDWKGAGIGAIVGAAVGAGLAYGFQAGGIAVTSTAGGAPQATLAWSITSSALKTACLNMAITSAMGSSQDDIFKSGVAGLISGGISGSIDFALPKDNFGFLEGFGVGALTGAASYGIEGYIDGKRGSDLLEYMGKGALITGISNGIAEGLSAWQDGKDFWTGENSKISYGNCYKNVYPSKKVFRFNKRGGFIRQGSENGFTHSYGFAWDFTGGKKWWNFTGFRRNLLGGSSLFGKGLNWDFPIFVGLKIFK